MLKLFRRLFKSDSFNDGYITIVYLAKGNGVIVRNTLTSSWEVTSEMDGHDVLELISEPPFDDDPLFIMNPATGLPMINDFIDVGGNPIGSGGD